MQSKDDVIAVCVITVPERIPFFIKECFPTLIQQSSYPAQLIIIVNGETSGEETMSLRVISEELANRGVYVQIILISPQAPVGFCRKLGVEFSSCKYVTFIDDDVVLEKNWLKNIVKSLPYQPDILGGRVEILDQKFWEPFIRKHPFFVEYIFVKNYLLMKFKEKISQNLYIVSGVRGLWTNNLTIRRDFIKEIGNFRSLLGYLGDHVGGEDTELKHRAIKKNAKILYNHSAIVYHRISPRRLFIRYCFNRAFSHGLLYAIILPLFSIIKSIGYHLLTIMWYFIADRKKEFFLALMRTLTLFSALLYYRRTNKFLERRIDRLRQVKYEIIKLCPNN